MKIELEEKLKEAKTIPEMINILNEDYNLDKYELSLLYKNILIKNLDRIISLLNVPLRK